MSKLCSMKLLIILSHARKSPMDRFPQTSGRRLASWNCQIPWQGTEFPPDFNKLHTLLITAYTFTERPKTANNGRVTGKITNICLPNWQGSEEEIKFQCINSCLLSFLFIILKLSYIELDIKCENGFYE